MHQTSPPRRELGTGNEHHQQCQTFPLLVFRNLDVQPNPINDRVSNRGHRQREKEGESKAKKKKKITS